MPIELPTLIQRVVVDTTSYATAKTKTEGFLGGMRSKMMAFSGAATKYVTLPILGIGAGMLAAGMQVDQAYDNIIAKTGATGKKLEGLKQSFKNVAGNTPEDMAKVSDALAEVHQRTGFTGKGLEDITTKLIEMGRVAGQQLDFKKASIALAGFNLNARQQSAMLDKLFVVWQKTGVPIQRVIQLVSMGGPIFRQFGLSLDQTALLLGRFEKAGIPAQFAMRGLQKAFTQAAKEGKEPKQALEELITTMQDLAREGKTAELNDLAIKMFGPRGLGLAEAVANGKISLKDFQLELGNTSDAIRKTAERTDDFPEKMKKTFNKLVLAVAPFGLIIMDALGQVADFVGDVLEPVADFFEKMPGPVKTAILAVGGFLALVGPLVAVLGFLISPLTLVVAGIAALAVGMYELYTNNKEVREFLDGIWESIKGGIQFVRDLFEILFGSPDEESRMKLAHSDAMAFVEFFKREVVPVFESAWEIVQRIGEVVGMVIGEIVESFERAWPDIESVLESIAETASEVFESMRGVVDDVVGFVVENWPMIERAIRRIVQAVQPVVEKVVVTVAKAFRFIMFIVRNTAKVVAFVWRQVVAVVRALWDEFGKHILDVVVSIYEGIAKQVEGILDIFSGVFDFLEGIFTLDGEKILSGIESIFTGIWEIISGAINVILAPFKGLLGWIMDKLAPAFEFIKGVVTDTFDAITGAVGASWDFVSGIFNDIVSFIEDTFVGTWNTLEETVTGVWDGIATGIQTAWDTVSGIFDDVTSFVEGALSTCWKTFEDAAGTAWDNVSGAISGVLRHIGGLVADFLDVVGDIADAVGLGGVATTLYSASKSARGWGLAQGGKVPAGAGFLALAQGGQIGGFPEVQANSGPWRTDGIAAVVGEGRPQYPEYVIPTDPQYRTRSLMLMGEMMRDLGLAQGGTIDPRALQYINDSGKGGLLDKVGSLAGDVIEAIGSALRDIAAGALETVWPKLPVPEGLLGFPAGGINTVRQATIDLIRGEAEKTAEKFGKGPQFIRALANIGPGHPYSTSNRFGPNTYDCSGFMTAGLRAIGVHPSGTTSRTLQDWAGHDVSVSEAAKRVGALLFVGHTDGPRGHVGASRGDGTVWETPAAGRVTGISPIGRQPWTSGGIWPGMRRGGIFDMGGVLDAGWNLVRNNTGMPEALLPIELLARAMRDGGGKLDDSFVERLNDAAEAIMDAADALAAVPEGRQYPALSVRG